MVRYPLSMRQRSHDTSNTRHMSVRDSEQLSNGLMTAIDSEQSQAPDTTATDSTVADDNPQDAQMSNLTLDETAPAVSSDNGKVNC